MKRNYLQIINHFGLNNQIEKFKEEADELVEAIIEYENCDKSNKFDCECKLLHIEEEICDNLTMLLQFIEYYKIKQENIDRMLDFKYKRTLKRMETKYYEKM